MTPELLLISGKSGAGKSSAGKRAAAQIEGARHFSMGARLRAISRGEAPSRYAEELAGSRSRLDQHMAVGRPQLPNLVLEEFMAEQEGLVIVDGFPRYPDRVGHFKDMLATTGARVLAVCHIEVSDALAMSRAGSRQQRSPGVAENRTFLRKRLDDYYRKVLPTVAQLSEIAPVHLIDGQPPTEKVASQVVAVHTRTHAG